MRFRSSGGSSALVARPRRPCWPRTGARPLRGAGEGPARRRLLASPRTAGRSPTRSSTPDVEANRSRSAIWVAPAGRRRGAAHDLRREARLRPEVLAGRPQARVPLQPRRRLADLGPGPRGRRAGQGDVVSRPRSTATRWSPDGKWFVFASDVFPDCTDTACLEKTLKARAEVEGQGAGRRAPALPPLGLLEGRDAHAHLEGAGRRAEPPVDLTPGDRDAPPFAVGGGDDWDVSPDGQRARLRLESRQGRGPLDQRRSLVTSSRRPAAPREEPDGRQPGVRRLAALLARRQVDRLPRAEAARLRGRPFPPDAPRPRDRRGPRPDGRLRLLGGRVPLGAGLEVDLLRVPGARPRDAVPRRARGRRAGAAVDRRRDRRASSVAGGRVFFAHEHAVARRRSSGASGSTARRRRRSRTSTTRSSASSTLGEVSERFTDSSDGRKLQAWVVKPPGFDPSKKYPAVFLIHGGPQGAWVGRLVVPLEPAGLGGLRLRRLRGEPARLDRLRPGLPRRDQRRLGRPGLRRPDAPGRRPRVAAVRGQARRSAPRAPPTAATWSTGSPATRSASRRSSRTTAPSTSPRPTSRPRSSGFPNWEFKGWPWNSDLYREVEPDGVRRQLQDADARRSRARGTTACRSARACSSSPRSRSRTCRRSC